MSFHFPAVLIVSVGYMPRSSAAIGFLIPGAQKIADAYFGVDKVAILKQIEKYVAPK